MQKQIIIITVMQKELMIYFLHSHSMGIFAVVFFFFILNSKNFNGNITESNENNGNYKKS